MYQIFLNFVSAFAAIFLLFPDRINLVLALWIIFLAYYVANVTVITIYYLITNYQQLKQQSWSKLIISSKFITCRTLICKHRCRMQIEMKCSFVWGMMEAIHPMRPGNPGHHHILDSLEYIWKRTQVHYDRNMSAWLLKVK